MWVPVVATREGTRTRAGAPLAGSLWKKWDHQRRVNNNKKNQAFQVHQYIKMSAFEKSTLRASKYSTVALMGKQCNSQETIIIPGFDFVFFLLSFSRAGMPVQI